MHDLTRLPNCPTDQAEQISKCSVKIEESESAYCKPNISIPQLPTIDSNAGNYQSLDENSENNQNLEDVSEITGNVENANQVAERAEDFDLTNAMTRSIDEQEREHSKCDLLVDFGDTPSAEPVNSHRSTVNDNSSLLDQMLLDLTTPVDPITNRCDEFSDEKELEIYLQQLENEEDKKDEENVNSIQPRVDDVEKSLLDSPTEEDATDETENPTEIVNDDNVNEINVNESNVNSIESMNSTSSHPSESQSEDAGVNDAVAACAEREHEEIDEIEPIEEKEEKQSHVDSEIEAQANDDDVENVEDLQQQNEDGNDTFEYFLIEPCVHRKNLKLFDQFYY